MHPVPATLTPVTLAEAAECFRLGVAVNEREVPPMLLAVLLAHSALNTERWEGAYNNNLGRLEDPTGVWRYGYFLHPNTTRRLRAYPHPQTGAADFVRAIRKHPRAWQAAIEGNVVEYSVRLKEAGYYQEPEDEFRAGILPLAREFVRKLGEEPPLDASRHVLSVLSPGQKPPPLHASLATTEHTLPLGLGVRGPDVAYLQALLNVGETPVYDLVTQDAVMRFQSLAQLPATGVVDPATWERLLLTVKGA